jgi:methylmalonyl-CoA/ethylmalonyl-CoA epimerase
MFERIDHVGIVVAEIDSPLAVYGESFGMELLHREVLEELGLEVALLELGESRIELLAPLSADSVIGDAGLGTHHVASVGEGIDAALARPRERDVKLVDGFPKGGVLCSRIAFVHPHAASGALTELVQAAPA